MLTSTTTRQTVFLYYMKKFLLWNETSSHKLLLNALQKLVTFEFLFHLDYVMGSILHSLVNWSYNFIVLVHRSKHEILKYEYFVFHQVKFIFLFHAGTLMTYGYLSTERSRRNFMASTATCIELSFKNNIHQQKIPISGNYRCKLLRNKSNKPKIWVRIEKRNPKKINPSIKFPIRKRALKKAVLLQLDRITEYCCNENKEKLHFDNEINE